MGRPCPPPPPPPHVVSLVCGTPESNKNNSSNKNNKNNDKNDNVTGITSNLVRVLRYGTIIVREETCRYNDITWMMLGEDENFTHQ